MYTYYQVLVVSSLTIKFGLLSNFEFVHCKFTAEVDLLHWSRYLTKAKSLKFVFNGFF